MTKSQAQQNRETVSAFWTAMNDAGASLIPDIVKRYTHEDIDWHGLEPYNDVKGVGALIDRFWLPLLRSFPDLQRRCDVLLAGSYRDQDWVSASGYFSGAFAEDWNGNRRDRRKDADSLRRGNGAG